MRNILNTIWLHIRWIGFELLTGPPPLGRRNFIKMAKESAEARKTPYHLGDTVEYETSPGLEDMDYFLKYPKNTTVKGTVLSVWKNEIEVISPEVVEKHSGQPFKIVVFKRHAKKVNTH